MWSFDTKTRVWKKLMDFPIKITEHNAFVYKDYMYIMGGLVRSALTTYSSTLYRVNLQHPEKLETVSAAPYMGSSTQSSVVYKDKLYVFAGCHGKTQTYFNHIFEYDFIQTTWTAVNSTEKPSTRCYHVAVVHEDNMYVFGGYTGEVYLNDMWKFNFKTYQWTDITKKCINVPPPRSRAAAIVSDNEMYLVSGWYRQGYYVDTWVFNFGTLTWTQISDPKYKALDVSQHSITKIGDYFYVFGGFISATKQGSNAIHKYRIQPLPSLYGQHQ